MRAPPAFELTLRDAPGWRVAQVALWVLAGAGFGAWLGSVLDAQLPAGLAGLLRLTGLAGLTGLTGTDGSGPDGAQAQAAAARLAGSLALATLAGTLAGWIGWRLGRPAQLRLRWSGQGWQLHGPQGWQPAALRVMVDLGGWMLLQARPEAGRTRWVGAAKADIGPDGQLLRAALYCAPCVDPGRADEDRARS